MASDRSERDASVERVRGPIDALACLGQDDYARGFLLAALSGGVTILRAVLDALGKRERGWGRSSRVERGNVKPIRQHEPASRGHDS
jgi:hypothetical protein